MLIRSFLKAFYRPRPLPRTGKPPGTRRHCDAVGALAPRRLPHTYTDQAPGPAPGIDITELFQAATLRVRPVAGDRPERFP